MSSVKNNMEKMSEYKWPTQTEKDQYIKESMLPKANNKVVVKIE